MANDTHSTGVPPSGVPLRRPLDRRSFFKWLGAGAGAAVLTSGCDLMTEYGSLPFPFDTGTDAAVMLDFSNDFGVANYAYALEQLEAAFYVRAFATPYDGITDAERKILRDIRNHEVVHREFFRQGIPALGGTAIPALTFDFSAIDFTSRASVLGTARVFEDLGVAAYNGAGPLIADPDILLAAGKIVSVEARHAAAIRDLLNPLSASSVGEDDGVALDMAMGDDVIDENGLDRGFSPTDVLAAASAFIVNPITTSGL